MLISVRFILSFFRNIIEIGITDTAFFFLTFLFNSQLVPLPNSLAAQTPHKHLTDLPFFLPFLALTATLGYNRTITLLLVAPPWAFATLVAFGVARHADVTGERFWHISGPLLVGILGFIIAEATPNIGARYFSFFLVSPDRWFCFVLYVSLLTWSYTFYRWHRATPGSSCSSRGFLILCLDHLQSEVSSQATPLFPIFEIS